MKELPETPKRENGRANQNKPQYPKWWNPKRWGIFGAIAFIVFVVALFIATRFYVRHPNDTPAFVAGIIGMFTLYAILLQIFVSRMQWKAMQDSLERTDTLIEQNKDIVKSAERQAVAAEKALKLTQKHFDLTERPSLGTEGEMYWGEDPVTGEGFVEVVVKNSGRVPAVKVIGGFSSGIQVPGKFVPFDVCPEPQDGERVGMESQNTVAIGGITVLTTKNLPVEEFKQVLAGDLQYFVWLRLTYCKTPKQRKPYLFEHYCRYNASDGTFVVCQSHNNAT